MRKLLKRGLITIGALLLIVAILFFTLMERDVGHPKRPLKVPKEAVWRGAADEGFWLLLAGINFEKKEYHFNIFADYNGDLVMDANFKMSRNCKTDLPLDRRILDRILFYEDDNIKLDSCSLEIIYPAFGGTFWELEGNRDLNKQSLTLVKNCRTVREYNKRLGTRLR